MKKSTMQKIQTLAASGLYYEAAAVCPAHGDVGHPLVEFEPGDHLRAVAEAAASELGWQPGGDRLCIGPVRIGGWAGASPRAWQFSI